jgi:hypothetical protein
MIGLTTKLEFVRIGKLGQYLPARGVSLLREVLDLIRARILIQTLPLLRGQRKAYFNGMEKGNAGNRRSFGVEEIDIDDSGTDPVLIARDELRTFCRGSNRNSTFTVDGV